MYDFGLTDEQFWDLTPPQFAALSERHDERNQRDEFYAANVCAVVANCNRDEKRRPQPFSAKDFMPSVARDEEEEVAGDGEMAPNAILEHLKAAFPPREQPAEEAHG